MEAKKNNNAVFTGVRGFRSAAEDQDAFSVVQKEFEKELNHERALGEISKDCLRPNDFYTLINPDHLMKSLLAHSLEENNKIKEKGTISIDEKKYKLNVNDSKTQLEYSLELLKLDEDTIVVDFKKVSGSAFEFHEKVSSIKKVIESFWF